MDLTNHQARAKLCIENCMFFCVCQDVFTNL